MPTVQVEAQLTTDELLRAVQQLDKTELEKFVFQVVNLRAKQQAPSLPKNEAELLQKINQGLPKELLKKYNELVSKRQAEDLSPDEYNELLKLTDQVEKLEAHRVEYLAEMARLRQASMTDLMNSLGIQSPAYV
ncbi:MAG: STAS/SEC14 domain-containing protein [Candidatus Brocadiales bacterium]|nr:STAS/SEC14 domain-containing protein [Candidatus Brocadiales bacterium]